MALPAVRIEHNLRLIGHNDLGGAPNAGEGLAMKITPDGRRLFYVAHENPPIAFSILDLTEPARPELLRQVPVPHGEVRGNSLALHGDTLLLANQVTRPGQQPAGFQVYDLADPVSPREVSYFDTSGRTRRASTSCPSWTDATSTARPAQPTSSRATHATTSST